MNVLDLWLAREPLEDSQDLQVGDTRKNTPGAPREREEEESRTVRACPANPANPANPQRWIDQPDVVTVVEDLADEGMKPGQISRLLGLTRAEIITVLRRTGR